MNNKEDQLRKGGKRSEEVESGCSRWGMDGDIGPPYRLQTTAGVHDEMGEGHTR